MAVFGYQNLGFGAGGDIGIVEIDVGAINFNGTTSKIEYTNSLWRGITDPMNKSGGSGAQGCMSFWLKPVAITSAGSKPIMQIGSHNGTPSIRLAYNYSSGGVGGMYLEADFIGTANDASASVKYTTAIGSITGNAWNHIAFSFTGGNVTNFFIDGARVSSFGSTGSGADDEPGSFENTVFGFDGSVYGNFCLAEVFVDLIPRDLADMTDFISKIASPSAPTTKPSPIGKPVKINTTSDHFHLSGDSSTWSNQVSPDILGTQTLSNITDCATSPSD